jgi:flavin reductase (DIM6/NTAB) family NADH-FMN oxidoreductase RutF
VIYLARERRNRQETALGNHGGMSTPAVSTTSVAVSPRPIAVPAYAGDAAVLRQVFSGFPSGVAALAADVDGTPEVLVASSFTVGVSQEPPMAMFAVQKTSTTWPNLAAVARLGVSILGAEHGGITRQLASRDRAGRLRDVDIVRAQSGAILLEGAALWMECSIEHVYPAGDHDIIVLRLHGMSEHEHAPLIFHRSQFRTLA